MNPQHISRTIIELLHSTPHLGIVFTTLAFVIAFFETLAFVGYALPGIIMLYTLGTLAARYHLLPAYLIATALGGFCADLMSYHLGAQGSTFCDKKIQKYKNSIERARQLFAKYGIASIIIGKMIGIFRPVIAFIAGGMQMRKKTFIIASAIASILWATTYTALTFLVQRHFIRIIHFATNFGGILICITIAYLILRQKNRPSSHPDLSHLKKD